MSETVRPSIISARPASVTRLASTKVDRWALRRVQQTVATAPIRFVLWDGFELLPASRPALGTVRFRSRSALFGFLRDPDLNFGEAYMSGAVEIDGDLVAVLEAIYRALDSASSRRWRLWERRNDASAAKHNVHHHYDLGNDFYRLWLDREMVYT